MPNSKVVDALIAYKTKVEDIKFLCGVLRLAGLETYAEREIDAALKRIQRHIEQLESGETDAKLDKLSAHLDYSRLGRFSWYDALEHARGPAVTKFESAEKTLFQLIDLAQK